MGLVGLQVVSLINEAQLVGKEKKMEYLHQVRETVYIEWLATCRPAFNTKIWFLTLCLDLPTTTIHF